VPRYHLNSLFYLNTNENNALEFAITGNPVLFYLPVITSFLQHYTRRLQRCFPVEISTVHLLLYQIAGLDTPLGTRPPRLLLLNEWDYTFCQSEKQGNYFYPLSFTQQTKPVPIPFPLRARAGRLAPDPQPATC
jgi:hypothetical protein